MPKSKIKKKLIRPIHIQTIVFIIIYFIISNSVFYSSVYHSNIYVSFIAPFIFGLISSFVFLYLFSHRDFFHFIKNLEKAEEKAEKKYLGRFSRYGKFAASILVATVGGPIFLALTIRFLYPKSERKYFIAFISVLISTIISVSIAKGLFKMIF
jgi:hypothetical protein